MFIKAVISKLRFLFLLLKQSCKNTASVFLAKCPPWLQSHVYRIYRAGYAIKSDRWKVKNIQLEITYRCNLLCHKCNRYCNFVKLSYLKDSDMTEEQIERFIEQVKRKNIHLRMVNIMGGEPFLHPEIEKFVSLLFYKLTVKGYLDYIAISSNAILKDRLKGILADPNIKKAFDRKIIRVNYAPGPKDDLFYWALAAPIDLALRWDKCDWPRKCGVLLNAHGYWPGGACGAIARLFRFDEYARYDFPVEFAENWPRLKEDICKYCPAGCAELRNKKTGLVSLSYKKAIEKWMKGEAFTFKKF